MTREEAIKYLKEMKDECNDTIHKVRYVTQEEALEMAIKALEQEPSGDLISRQAVQDYIAKYLSQYLYNDVREAVEVIDEYIGELPSVNPQPCDDAISRQSVLNACEQSINILEAVDRIMDLPSVEQEPKTGHWISHYDEDAKEGWYECDRCHTERAFNTKFCPDCGCRMVETQERGGEE